MKAFIVNYGPQKLFLLLNCNLRSIFSLECGPPINLSLRPLLYYMDVFKVRVHCLRKQRSNNKNALLEKLPIRQKYCFFQMRQLKNVLALSLANHSESSSITLNFRGQIHKTFKVKFVNFLYLLALISRTKSVVFK